MSEDIGRFTIEVTKEQRDIFDHYVPFGLKKVIIGSLISDCCYMLEKYGAAYIAAILEKKINHRKDLFSPSSLSDEEEENEISGSDKRPEHSTPPRVI